MNMEEPIIKRIQKLLRLANDRGATRAEAENAMAMAQRLMTKYNISVANVSDNPAAQTRIHHEAFFTRKANFNVADRLIMNLLVWYLDRYTKPVRFGGASDDGKSGKKA